MNSTTLSATSPAKINLFLHITGQRSDGYHLLQSIFCPITLSDNISLMLEQSDHNELNIERLGDLQHIPLEYDLSVRACKAFYAHAGVGQAFFIRIHIQKNIPEQAGLGGGSSNAATVLRLLEKHHGNPISPEKLTEIGLSLGADVPFFLQDQSAFVEGIGELITPLTSVQGHVLVYKPPLSCSTAQIFHDPQLTRNSSDVKIALLDWSTRINDELMAYLQANTENTLQTVVSRKFLAWKHQFNVFSNCMKKFNPQLVRMSGSGSAMFAIFATLSQVSDAVLAAKKEAELETGQLFQCMISTKGYTAG